jgi:hypothetical protein
MNTSSTYIPEEIVRHILSYSNEPMLLGVSSVLEDIENEMIRKYLYNPSSRKMSMIVAKRSWHLGRRDITISMLDGVGKVGVLEYLFFISRYSDSDIDTYISKYLMSYTSICQYPIEVVTAYAASKAIKYDNVSLLLNMLDKGAKYDDISPNLTDLPNSAYNYFNKRILMNDIVFMLLLVSILSVIMCMICYLI